jgi:hypothetical protein
VEIPLHTKEKAVTSHHRHSPPPAAARRHHLNHHKPSPLVKVERLIHTKGKATVDVLNATNDRDVAVKKSGGDLVEAKLVVYMHIHIHAYIHTHIYVYIYIDTNIYIYIYV